MNEIKLFRFNDEDAVELNGYFMHLERDLQRLIEKHMERFLNIRFIAHEYNTGKNQRGQIDSLGLDENNCPVIIEYKRRNDENVITQGLYYLDWLLDHQNNFSILVKEQIDLETALKIEFSGTRVLCVASSFSKYDERAINQIERNIGLVRYKFFADNLLMLEFLNNYVTPFIINVKPPTITGNGGEDTVVMPHSMELRIKSMSDAMESLYLELMSYIETLGNDVSIRFLKHYVAVKRVKNFASIQPLKECIRVWLNLDPARLVLEEGFSRDVSNVGHHSSGQLEVNINSEENLAKAKPLLALAYEQN